MSEWIEFALRNVRIYSHNPNSEGAKQLALELGIKRIKHDGSRFQPNNRHTLINWGSGRDPPHGDAYGKILNRPDQVLVGGDKLGTFKVLRASDIRIPDFTTDPWVARSWIDDGVVVVARTVLRGHSGQGIVVLDKTVDFVQAPLYTKYIKKEQEYRVHCFRFDQAQQPSCRIIDVQRKIKRPDFEGQPNWRVRNHQNGFIYVRNDVHPPEDVTRQALQAFEALGLDFAAVDVIWNARSSLAYVLEGNTAPGLVGETVRAYGRAFREALSDA